MTLVIPPSVMEMLVRHTKACPEVVAMVGNRVSNRPNAKTEKNPRGWVMPTYAIVWQPVGGEGDHQSGLPFRTLRVDAWCYAERMFMADTLQRTLDAYLCPDRDRSFVDGDCRVWDVFSHATVNLPDPVGPWPRVIGQYSITYGRVPA